MVIGEFSVGLNWPPFDRTPRPALVDRLQHLEPSVSGGDDVIGVGSPYERLGFGDVVLGDETVDGS